MDLKTFPGLTCAGPVPLGGPAGPPGSLSTDRGAVIPGTWTASRAGAGPEQHLPHLSPAGLPVPPGLLLVPREKLALKYIVFTSGFEIPTKNVKQIPSVMIKFGVYCDK